MNQPVRKQLLVSGRVQGVGYRWFVMESARQLGIVGWVKNLADGRVEAEVQGDADAVERLIDELRHGPRLAHVSDLAVIPLPYEINLYNDFLVRHG
jgi:acylphosphatase